MPTAPISSGQLPRCRRVVYRDGRCSTVHRFRYAAAHLEARRTGRQWHVDQLIPRTAPVPREAVERCATTLARPRAQAAAPLDRRAVQVSDHTDDNLRAYAAAGCDVIDPATSHRPGAHGVCVNLRAGPLAHTLVRPRRTHPPRKITMPPPRATAQESCGPIDGPVQNGAPRVVWIAAYEARERAVPDGVGRLRSKAGRRNGFQVWVWLFEGMAK